MKKAVLLYYFRTAFFIIETKIHKQLFILMSHLFYLFSIFMLSDLLASFFYNTAH